jgi:PBSX family phage terminase large subunit
MTENGHEREKMIDDTSNTVTVRYSPLGAARALFSCRDGELAIDGPAGTGKTRAILEKLHLIMLKYPNAKALMTRKAGTSLAATAVQTYQHKVLHPLDGVRYFGGSRKEPPAFVYPNGSKIVVTGLDKPEKVMSSEYDIIYVNEATECTLTDIESLTTRLRNGVVPYQQLIMDCNPGPPNHWLKQRMDAGITKRLISRHEDNPAVTPEYLARLDNLTGVRYLRLRKGIWASAEGTVYEDVWDEAVNVIDRFDIPKEWRRFISIDFGYRNPFVCQWWAVDHDGRLYLYREIYKTNRTVRDHVKDIVYKSKWGKPDGEPFPHAIITDHDAEDRATIEQELRERGLAIMTTAARKSISPGIQAVQARLKPAGDGKARLFFFRDALVERDTELEAHGLPISTIQEFDSYIWNDKKDEPVDKDNHGQDACRYAVAHFDLGPNQVTYHESLW